MHSSMPMSFLLVSFFTSTILRSATVCGRQWNDTGKGTIIFEEAWTIPAIDDQMIVDGAHGGETGAEVQADLLDIHNQRLARMDANGVDYMVFSCVTPCIQGISDPEVAEAMARNVNNQLAASISNNTVRFGGFASLAMHNATTAAQELKRAVLDLGFLGALINDYQQSGPDNATLLFYDRPEYDVFWEMVTELDVPVYLHPRPNIAQVQMLLYEHAPWLVTAQNAATISTHVMGLCTNGVFECRFPKLNVIVGHLGERLPSDLFRIDEQLALQVPAGMPMRRNFSSYWQTNLYETVSGNFATELYKFHINQIGLNRIMYSVDYPFISMEEGEEWLKELSKTMSHKDLLALKRGLAVGVLHLNR